MQFKVPFGQKKPSDLMKGYVQVTLSTEGIREAESFTGSGDEFEVLSALLMKRPDSIGNIAKATNMPFNKCLNVCRELKNKRLVTQVSSGQ